MNYSLHDMDELTQSYHQDLNQITNQFVSVLESQGIDSSVLEQLINSISCNCFLRILLFAYFLQDFTVNKLVNVTF